MMQKLHHINICSEILLSTLTNETDVFWAAGINGEGSSVVAFSFIEHLVVNQDVSNMFIAYTAKSTLSEKISSLNLSALESLSSRHIYLFRLPKAFRLYPIHFLVKFCFPIGMFSRRCFVFDDFPFRLCSRQLLYFHQPNLIYGSSLLWKIKRLAFVMLKPKSLMLNFQTCHIRDSFVRTFGQCKSMCLLHQV